MTGTRLRLGISRCLLGERVRYDGGHKHDRFLTHTFGDHVDWIAVCPEVEAGLGIPREPVRLVDRPDGIRLVARHSGRDLTEDVRAVAEARAGQLAAAGIDGFVLKAGSPSCGLDQVEVHTASAARRDGRGVFAEVLTTRLPLLPVEEAERLDDPMGRADFLDRVYAHHRWRTFVSTSSGVGDLVAFHTRHKLTLLSHSPAHYRGLGRLVATAGRDGADSEYGRTFAEAMAVPTTRGKHLNVLQHLQGYLRDVLGSDDRAELDAVLAEYGRGALPWLVPVRLLREHFGRHPDAWVAQQVYLDPYPAELMLRDHA